MENQTPLFPPVPPTISQWRVTESNPVRISDGLDVERCIALHNELLRASVSGRPGEPDFRTWFQDHGEDAKAVRGRLSPSLEAFLQQALKLHREIGDHPEHSLFYYVTCLTPPSRMWRPYPGYNDNRFVTLYNGNPFLESDADGLVFDQWENKAIMQMSIFDTGTTLNGRQEWHPLEVVLSAWLDMIDVGKVQAVVDEEAEEWEEEEKEKQYQWIWRSYSEAQLTETVEEFDAVVEAIESRVPPSASSPVAASAEEPERGEKLVDDTSALDAARIPPGFTRSFLSRARRPLFRFIAPGLEIPSPETVIPQPFTHIDDPAGEPESRPALPPILLFRSDEIFTAPESADPGDIHRFDLPFPWPWHTHVSSYPAGLYLDGEVERGSKGEFEDGVRLVLPYGIGAHGFARTADGARFGENTEAPEVTAKDTYSDLYQLGFVPFGDFHSVRLAHVFRAWREQVESGQWTVGPEGVEGGMDKWREADTEDGWKGYSAPVTW